MHRVCTTLARFALLAAVCSVFATASPAQAATNNTISRCQSQLHGGNGSDNDVHNFGASHALIFKYLFGFRWSGGNIVGYVHYNAQTVRAYCPGATFYGDNRDWVRP